MLREAWYIYSGKNIDIKEYWELMSIKNVIVKSIKVNENNTTSLRSLGTKHNCLPAE